MRRVGVGTLCCAAAAAVAVAAQGGGRPLPLRSLPPVTSRLLAMVPAPGGSRLAQVDPATFAVQRASPLVGWYDGWVASPDGKLLALATHADGTDASISILRFATAATLGFARQGVRLDGYFLAAIWPRGRTLYALAGDCCDAGLTLDTVDTATKKVVARTTIDGPALDVARSSDGLVLLAAPDNAIGPARLIAIGPDGSVRSLQLPRILAGTHFDQSSRDPIGSTRRPGLAVDPANDVAYLVDQDDLVAEIRLDDLRVAYHRLGSGSLLDRIAGWLTPPAQAKGLNGPTLTARWLGDGLLAVTGTDYSASRKHDGSGTFSAAPAGLRIVDTQDWSVRTLDTTTDTAVVADGTLLAAGGSWSSGRSGTTGSGEGVLAYGADGSPRWRLDAGDRMVLVTAYRTRALVQKAVTDAGGDPPLQLLDVATGRVIRTLPADDDPWLLLGSGS